MSSMACALLFLVLWPLSTRAAVNVTAAPLSIPPSEYFDGDDGQWSTFHVQVGTPGQTLRLLPGTSASAGSTIWVVLPEGCTDANPDLADCANERGELFTRNESTTWSTERLGNNGLFQLNTFEESYLGLTGNAYYGFDTVTPGLVGSSVPTLEGQTIAGFATNNYWLGSLGLSAVSFNFTSLTDPVPSFLGNLRNQSLIPSSSWGYTAGASYQDPQVFGSLTLGGFDTTRFDANNSISDIAFGADFSRDLLLQLSVISYDTIDSSPLLTESIPIFIDSLVTQLWLPVEVCQAFEQAFNLTWNETAQLYLLDDDVHDALAAQNPTFTFTLAANSTSQQTVDITLPYAAFDLNVTQPVVESSARYFPLKQAQNSSQYTLGRVFLQEAYVTADYERHNFSVSQALFPSTSISQNLVAILPPGASIEETGGSSLSGGAIAGVAVGGVVAGLLIAGLLWWFFYKRKHRKQRPTADPSVPSAAEEKDRLESTAMLGKPELDAREAGRYELDQNYLSRPELPSEGKYPEKDGTPKLHASPAHEMDTGTIAAIELEAPVHS